MKPHFVKQAALKTGTNVRSRTQAKYQAEVLAKLQRPLERLAREQRRSMKQLFSKAELRAAAEAALRVRQQYHATNLELGADSKKWRVNHEKHRAALRRELRRLLPNFRAWEAAAKAHRREYQRLVRSEMAALVDRRAHIRWGDVLPPDPSETYELAPPFSLYGVGSAQFGIAAASAEDLSAAAPSSGYLLTRIEYDFEYSDWFLPSAFNILVSDVHCGTDFTTPVAGRLHIAATLHNFYNDISFAIRDRFGFSSAEFHLYLCLRIAIVRPGQYLPFETELLHDGYFSPGGVEATGYLASLDSTTPYIVERTTDEVFPANSSLQILAGSRIYMFCEADDMAIHVGLRLGWRLQKLSVTVV